MKVKVTATRSDRKVSWLNWISEPIPYEKSLGVRDFDSLDEAFRVLREETGEEQYVVIFDCDKTPGETQEADIEIEIEIYNNYRE